MPKFKVKSGGWAATIEASDAKEAVTNAIKRDMPKSLGYLVHVERPGGEALYFATTAILEFAGLMKEEKK